MIIKYTLNNNDLTQVIEQHLEEYSPFLGTLNTIDENIEFKDNIMKYDEMSKDDLERKALKQKLIKTIKQKFKDYINSIQPNSNWHTDGFNAKELIESKSYILRNIRINIVNSISDKWQNGEVVYYFTSNMKYLTM